MLTLKMVLKKGLKEEMMEAVHVGAAIKSEPYSFTEFK